MLTQMLYKKAQVVLKFYPPTSPSSYLFNNYIRNGKMFCGSNLIFWFTDHSAGCVLPHKRNFALGIDIEMTMCMRYTYFECWTKNMNVK